MPKNSGDKLAVRSGERAWTKKEIARVEKELNDDMHRLTLELDQTARDLADILRDGVDVAGADQADVGSTSLERDSELALAANQNELLTQTKMALSRLADGTYGDCANCEQPIGKERLLAYPRATLCIECKQREERR